MSEFDPKKPYSEVQGDSRAAFYQAGQYYCHDHSPLKPEDAGKPGETGSYANQVQSAVDERMARENSKKPLTLIDETNPHTNSQADIDAARERAKDRKTVEPKEVEPPVIKTAADALRKARTEELKKLNISQLRHLVAEAGLTPALGRGSTFANIKLLLDNTE